MYKLLKDHSMEEIYAMMASHKNGKTIEMLVNGKWQTAVMPLWWPNCTYRVKH
jgi:hypothetical protein